MITIASPVARRRAITTARRARFRGCQTLVAQLDHPHTRLEELLEEPLERGCIRAAIDEHAERHVRQTVCRPRRTRHRLLEGVEPVAEGLEPRRLARGHHEGHLLEAAERLGRPGRVGGDEIGRAPPDEGGLRHDRCPHVAERVAAGDATREHRRGEHGRELMTQRFCFGRHVGVVEDEAGHVLDHAEGFGGPIGRRVAEPPCPRGRRRALAIAGFKPVFHALCCSVSGPADALEKRPAAPTLPRPSPGKRPMRVLRPLTLIWPGLPWLWLRGSVAGLVLALAFAVVFDMAILSTWIWNEFLEGPIVVGLWAAAGAIWMAATISAVVAFPAPIQTGHDAAADALFTAARDAYLARDWLSAETKLRSLLVVRPTDGEAQLLLGTLLRRVGRFREARAALEALARSDAGGPWRSAIAREIDRIEAAADEPGGDTREEQPRVLKIDHGVPTAASAERAA